ncbi:PREDICTED: low affinity immunoglobulin gamma Fc region receptor III-like [Elephantulus edwardii]|uniref:low affinity immunoglobulin gamma Fc region receptor III-like n=1 Tax=Elephantulus edwardii TaxID=28737 RepID=UPI0003F0CE66|nr:PREDICTED: low affinity immunoglobulin gamma Fc region receptor III-like [Elephantulus edwardii]
MTFEIQMFQTIYSNNLCLLQTLTVLLLLASVDGQAADLPKAVVNIEPPWINVLREDYVTLKCHGAYIPGNHSTQWFHRGSLVPTGVQPSYRFKAALDDSGDYRCQTPLTSLSNPVQLEVFSKWLLLQTPKLVFQEGDPIALRCHSWRDKCLYKVTFFQNGKSTSYSNTNSNFYIPQANHSHSGDYHCTGYLGNLLHQSHTVTITVQGSTIPSMPPLFLSWYQVTFFLVMGLLFTVDTGLYLFLQRELQSSKGNWKNRKARWNQGPQDK